MSNHPPHIIDHDKKLTPSALIPFCDFGGSMSAMGTIIDQFDVPVCNSFKAKIFKDQLCYEVDPNDFINKDYLNKKKLGMSFYIDTNEDRQVPSASSVDSTFKVYLDTLGNNFDVCLMLHVDKYIIINLIVV